MSTRDNGRQYRMPGLAHSTNDSKLRYFYWLHSISLQVKDQSMRGTSVLLLLFLGITATTSAQKILKFRKDHINVSYNRELEYGHVSDLFTHRSFAQYALVVVTSIILLFGIVSLIFGDLRFRDDSENFVHNPAILLYAVQLRKYEKLLDSDIYRNIIDRIRVQGHYQPYSFGRIVRDYTLTMRAAQRSENLSKTLHAVTVDGIGLFPLFFVVIYMFHASEGKQQIARTGDNERSKCSVGAGVQKRKAGRTLFQLSQMDGSQRVDKKKSDADVFFHRLQELRKHFVIPQAKPPSSVVLSSSKAV
uniref:Uncharacterized protein n=1 Tax=Steinernema glaseri TaxID=37863 RepID=A0A1I8AVP8_9BILA